MNEADTKKHRADEARKRRSRMRIGEKDHRCSWCRLPQTVGADGHMYVIVVDNTGTAQSRLTGECVLETFVGPCPEGHELAHKDDDKTNNRIINVEWRKLEPPN